MATSWLPVPRSAGVDGQHQSHRKTIMFVWMNEWMNEWNIYTGLCLVWVQEYGVWVTDPDSEAAVVSVPAALMIRIVPADYSQRQDRGPSNPHGEHAHDIWQVGGFIWRAYWIVSLRFASQATAIKVLWSGFQFSELSSVSWASLFIWNFTDTGSGRRTVTHHIKEVKENLTWHAKSLYYTIAFHVSKQAS